MPAKFKGNERPRKSASPERTPLNFYRSAGKSDDNSPFEKRAPKPKKNRLVSRVADMTLLILLVIGLVYCMTIRPQPELNLNSELYHSSSDYQNAAAVELTALKNRNKLTFDEKSVVFNLQKRFPEIESASVDLPLFSQTPKLNINVAGPAFVLNNQDAEYVVNTRGVAVAKRSDLPPLKDLPTVIDQTGFNAQAGKQVISSAEVNFINTLVTELKMARVQIATMTLPAKAQELDLRTKDESYYTKFYLGGDPLTQTGQYLAARHQFNQNAKQPSKYLDVRVNGKIYYR